jgi:hypothetical protein
MAKESHSNLKADPKSNLAILRPNNEEIEKEKFRQYWTNFSTKNKVYNPRFSYDNNQASMQILSDMKVVFSNRYKQHAKIVIDEVIKVHGSAQGYKETAWGNEIEPDQVVKITEQYLDRFKLDVHFYFGKSLVTTMSA